LGERFFEGGSLEERGGVTENFVGVGGIIGGAGGGADGKQDIALDSECLRGLLVTGGKRDAGSDLVQKRRPGGGAFGQREGKLDSGRRQLVHLLRRLGET
jgi:hypothetical protein